MVSDDIVESLRKKVRKRKKCEETWKRNQCKLKYHTGQAVKKGNLHQNLLAAGRYRANVAILRLLVDDDAVIK